MTIADAILHVRYTARDAGALLASHATKELKEMFGQAGLALLFSLRYDFPTEWSAFVNGSGGYGFALRKDHSPYMAQGAKLSVDGLVLYAQSGAKTAQVVQTSVDLGQLSANLNSATGASPVTLPADSSNASVLACSATAQVFLVVQYSLGG
jgi:hypothetical protein